MAVSTLESGNPRVGSRVGQVPSADGVPIRHEVRGAGEPAVVLVHGWSCDRRYWCRQVDLLAARYTVVTVDLAGHGESGTGRRSWTMPAFGADVAAVVTALDLAHVVLVGHSMAVVHGVSFRSGTRIVLTDGPFA